MQPREAECSEGFAANGWSSKIASRAKLKETCGVHRPDATTARIFAADFLQMQQTIRPDSTRRCAGLRSALIDCCSGIGRSPL
jgi:hypothetical protein